MLFVDANTGGVDLAMDSHNPNVLYAAMWQAQRVPWKLTSGGPGSGLYKTTDAGAHWTKISSNPGYATGTLGKIGVAVAASNPRDRLLDRAGARRRRLPFQRRRCDLEAREQSEMKLRQRAFYYMALTVDPTNPQVLYAPQVDGVYHSTDGGKTWSALEPPHGDNHIVWVNPKNPKILLEGNDGGATVSVDGGRDVEHRAQSADGPVLSRCARRPVSVPRLRRLAG